MDFSKLLNAIRGNKAADASAAPKDRPESETVVQVEVSPTVAAADHPPPLRPSGGVVQSLLGQFTSHREPLPPPPGPPVPTPVNGYDDVLASVLPPPAPPVSAKPPVNPPGLAASSPLDGDWFDVSLGDEPPPATTGSEASILEIPLDTPPSNAIPADFFSDPLAGVPATASPVDPFEVSGKVDLSWTPTEPTVTDTTTFSPVVPPPPIVPPPPVMPFPFLDASAEPETFPPMDIGAAPEVVPSPAPAFEEPYTRPATADAAAPEPPAAVEADARISYADWLVENLDEALFLVDAQGVLRYLNPMAEYLLACPRTEALGRTLLDIGQQLGGDNAPLWEHLAVTSEAQQFSTNIMLPDGQSMMASFVIIDLPAQPDWPGGRAIAVRDETRLRAEMAQIIEDLTASAAPPSPSALNVTTEQLTAMRTSLQMVLGFAELLHRGEYGQMNPQQFEMFRNIEHHAKQLAEWLGLPQS